MDSEFKAFIVALVATPCAFAVVALIEKVGVFSFSKYGALQVISFLVGVTYVVAQKIFKTSDVAAPASVIKDDESDKLNKK
ncbi:hypothetical protein B9Z36_08125 [Limnohabitans sp. Rim8]|uniref:hypothetical protein n=1 Tax=Limnohabitans sp. Rim8 TaxID=1100718 RepID=UPI000D3389A1|nr:hypothetical protein [Limnohabitans sp. Rim8]PUE56961.1 hypothetical protein B9Z36_08125 [Limnohabitans sp. Rim8]